MSKLIYNWKRFWCPREASFSLSDGGYLSDPEAQWGKFDNPTVKPFETIAETPCLILLGEPGIGKTSASKAEWQALEAKVKQEEEETLWFDLRSYSDEYRLVRNLFESEKFSVWTKGAHRLHLFLDSLDEGLLRIDTLAALLAEELAKYKKHVDRLSLRIGCRTAEWPSSLERALQLLWGERAVGVYELVPLRRLDVIEAARVNNVDQNSFLSEIERAVAVPLAIKPVTLNLLLRIYQQHSNFPKTQADLYLEGCRLLCEETNEDRRTARLIGNLSADQRLAVAARIAAVSIFANRDAVWTTVDQGDVPAEDVTVRELSGGSERAQGNAFEVGESAIREVLDTGLFSARGPNRLGWAHQTYAEFLAAHYLVQHQMTLAQMMSLIVHPGDTEKKLVPQLHETAAWLASMAPEVFREIMKSDPEVLLRSDVATAEVKDRAALVDTLLKLYDEGKLLDSDWSLHGHYPKFAHPGLVEQLRPYICKNSKNVIARRVAIDIAEACKLQSLQEELVSVALDPSSPLSVRVEAAMAVGRIGDETTKAKLKPLALGETSEDPDDELKGAGLQAVWPDHLSAKELFPCLTPPKNEKLVGQYRMFLSHDLVKRIGPADLPVTLSWVAKQSYDKALLRFERLADEIVLRAWEQLEAPGVAEAFAKTALTRLKRQHRIFRENSVQSEEIFQSDDNKRRLLLQTMVSFVSSDEEDISNLVYSPTPIAFDSDVSWILEQLRSCTSNELQRTWARLLEGVFGRDGPSQIDAVLTACQENQILAEVFSRHIKVELDSVEAQEMKRQYLQKQHLYLRLQHHRQKAEDLPLLTPPLAERMEMLLAECETGDSAAWWRLNPEMTLEPDSTHYGDEFKSDLTALPGWKIAGSITRARIVETAKKYLLEKSPYTSEWLGKSIFDRRAAAGYRALRLLWQVEPEWLSSIEVETWRKWAPVTLGYPVSTSNDETGARRALVKLAYQYVPKEIVETLRVLIDEENEKNGDIFLLWAIDDCWDTYLKEVLLAKAKDEKLRPKSSGRLLGALLDQGVEDARSFAEAEVSSFSIDDVNKRDRAITAACMLMTHAEDAGWSIVWPAIQQDKQFGREVLSSVAFGVNTGRINATSPLTEEQLADLYLWLVHQYPYAEDPNHRDGYVVGPRERATDFRNSLLQQIKTRGTPQACAAIRRIMQELPKLDWLKWTLLEAKAIMRRQTWLPPRPQDILTIASSQQKRLVQSGEQLLEVLVESLRRLEEKLQGETPAVIDLWDEIAKGVYRPRDENRFSDYVERHLRDDLTPRKIIVNREVEIRRGEGSTRGECTDIHVDVIVTKESGEEPERVSAIIEVKGCWNKKELNHAMKTQLVERYLKDNLCQFGLYLVGWFNCQQWDKEDYRKGQAPKIDIEEARKQFDAQARELSQAELEIRAFVMNTALR